MPAIIEGRGADGKAANGCSTGIPVPRRLDRVRTIHSAPTRRIESPTMCATRQSEPAAEATAETFEGDYRPAQVDLPTVPGTLPVTHVIEPNIRLEPLQVDFLMRVA
ncbi:MAG TPA: hypothetical protein VF865_11430, partial [Acidobacteriaceae bacterium]